MSKIAEMLEKGILVCPEMKDEMDTTDYDNGLSDNILFLDSSVLKLKKSDTEVNWRELEIAKAMMEKKGRTGPYEMFVGLEGGAKPKKQPDTGINIIKSYEEESYKRDVQDFTLYFNSRLESIQKVLTSRDELRGVTAISRILAKQDRETVRCIGMVKEMSVTKNGNVMLTLEDSTGEIKVLINKNKPDIFEQAKDIVLDETLGIVGVNGDNIIFANNVIWPDVPISNQLKRSGEEGYAVFLSDIHVGSNNFLGEDFKRFINWVSGGTGNEKQKELASKVKYIFVIGDLVDGVGIYPNQEGDLSIPDIYEQYKECARLLAEIPSHIKIIICAGNHDALRMAEPQPPLYKEMCPEIHEMKNVTLVSNPSTVNIHSSKDFSGYNVLLYHGFSFDYYIANVDSIRNNGGYDRPDLIMKFLLKRRHLAPTHISTLYAPYTDKDPLFIDPIPDFFVTGHIHKCGISHYRNITMICGSCWQSKTDFQEKVGHHPEPSRVPIVDLKTRDVKILRFGNG